VLNESTNLKLSNNHSYPMLESPAPPCASPPISKAACPPLSTSFSAWLVPSPSCLVSSAPQRYPHSSSLLHVLRPSSCWIVDRSFHYSAQIGPGSPPATRRAPQRPFRPRGSVSADDVCTHRLDSGCPARPRCEARRNDQRCLECDRC